MRARITFIVTIVLVSICCVYSENQAAETDVSRIKKLWARDINYYKRWCDAKSSVPDNAILFVGDSTVTSWETARLFPEMDVINRGLVGADIKAINYYFNQIVSPYKPSKIVFVAGANEISRSVSYKTVSEDFKVFYNLCAEKLPDTEIIFISIKVSGQHVRFSRDIKKANDLIKAFCETKPNVQYVDLASSVLDANGIPVDKFFGLNRLNLNEAGYHLWTEKLKSILIVPEKKSAAK